MSFVDLHLMLNHVPVIGVMIVVFLLAIALVRRSSELSKVALTLLVVLGMVSVVVFLTGEPAEELIDGLAGVSQPALERHEDVAKYAMAVMEGIGLFALVVLAYFGRRTVPRWVTAVALLLSLGASGTMAVTASLGGKIRHTELGQVAGDGSDTEAEAAPSGAPRS